MYIPNLSTLLLNSVLIKTAFETMRRLVSHYKNSRTIRKHVLEIVLSQFFRKQLFLFL